MALRKKLLTLESMNQSVRGAKVPILGSLTIRAAEIQREIQEGIHKPFTQITPCFFGDMQAMGHKPFTFLRQVASLCTYSELLESDQFPEDAKTRAQAILKNLDDGSVGSYNPRYIAQTLPPKIASFIQRRDNGVPSNPRNVIVCSGTSQAVLGEITWARKLCEISTGSYNPRYIAQTLPPKIASFIQRRDNGVPSNPRNVIVCSGTSQAVLSVLSLIVNDEEELKTGILLSVPYYPLYMDTIALSGAVMIPYYLDEDCGWAVNVDRIRKSLPAARKHCNPKVLCVINPGNPTGHILTRDNITALIHLAAEENLLIFADEVYQANVFGSGAIFHSFKKVLYEMGPRYSERVQLVSINSISKGISGECGSRAGYIEFVNIDPAVFEVLYILKSFNVPPVIGSLMLEVLLDPPQPGDPSYETFLREKQTLLNNLAEKAQITEEILNQAPGIHCNPILGALYAFPRVSIPDRAIRLAQDRGLEPDDFYCHVLLEDTGIVLCSGNGFGQMPGTYHFRITLLHPIDELKSILHKITHFHARFIAEYS